LIETNVRNDVIAVRTELIKRKVSPVSEMAYFNGVPIVIFEFGGKTDWINLIESLNYFSISSSEPV